MELSADLLPFVGILLAAGVVAGTLSGLLGVGGGIVVVPVLYYVFNLLGVAPDAIMHLAVGTSLATVVITSARSARSHHKKGSLSMDLFWTMAPGVLVGSLIGTAVGSIVSGDVLTGIFGVLALVVALNMGFGKEEWRLADQLPDFIGRLGLGSFIGSFSVMAGLGAGSLGVTVMTLFNTAVHTAVGTAAALGIVVAVPGVIGFIYSGWGLSDLPDGSLGFVNLLAFLCIIPASLLSAPLGVKIAHSFSPLLLRRAFALFLAITSFRMFYSLFG